MTGFIAQTAGGENPVGSDGVQHAVRRGPAAVPHHAGDQHRSASPSSVASGRPTDEHRDPEYTAREVTVEPSSTGRSRDRNTSVLVFLVLLWFSLFFGVMVLLVLIVNTAIEGAARFDSDADHATTTPRSSPSAPASVPASSGTLWLMVTTALMAVPLGIAAALYLEEFADKDALVQPDHRAQPAEPRGRALDRLRPARRGGDGAAGLPAQGHRPRRRDRPGPADPPGHHHHHPRGRARGSDRHPVRISGPGRHPAADHLAPDAALCRSPASPPGRSSGCPGPSARRLRCSWSGSPAPCGSTPRACSARSPRCRSRSTRLTSQSQEAYQQAAAAAIIVLLVMVLGCSTGWPSSSATSSSETW